MGTKLLCVMGIVMLICLITLGMFSLPVGIPLCSIMGLIYGVKHHDKRFIGWSVTGLLVGGMAALYTWLLVLSM